MGKKTKLLTMQPNEHTAAARALAAFLARVYRDIARQMLAEAERVARK